MDGVPRGTFRFPLIAAGADSVGGVNDSDTLVRFGLPAVIVIGNDAGRGEIRVPQAGI